MSETNGTPAPRVKLGCMVEHGVAPSIFGLLERGIACEPELAAGMRGRAALRRLRSGRLSLEGDRALARRLLRLLAA